MRRTRFEDDAIGTLSTSPVRKRTIIHWIGGMFVLTFMGCFMLLSDKHDENAAVLQRTKDEVQLEKLPVLKGTCGAFCKARLDQRQQHHGGDFLSNSDILQLVQNSRDKVIADLKLKYGDTTFSRVFESSQGKLRETFVTPNKNGPSIRRFQRKLQMKILEVQANIFRENAKLLKGCNCNGRIIETRRELGSKMIELPAVDPFFSRFVWSTGGHSAAAGHGNLHNQSYTAFMESAAKPVFEAIGIQFEARNYAMGGMASAPLLALCNEAIYGTDADVLSWDFGMTDSRNYHKKGVFANRAGVHRNRPAIIDMNIFGAISRERIEELQVVEKYGLTTLHIKENAAESMMKGIPDMFGLSQDQIDATPEFTRHVKCAGIIEKGDPTCTSNKFFEGICPQRMHKTSWHPGWRVHAMYGHTMGLFLIDALIQAIEGLGPSDYDPEVKLNELKEHEDNDYKTFFQSTVDSGRVEEFVNASITSHLSPHIFYRERGVCHTTLLPSESRYKGYFSGVRTEGGDYEKGIARPTLDLEPAKGKLRVAMDVDERQDWCPVPLKIDFKDYFYANENDGWVSLTFPNSLESDEYRPWEPRGVIVVCFGFCAWKMCPPGDRRMSDLNEKLLAITVNDIPVSRFWPLSNEDTCGVAESDGGWYFPQNKGGQYNVSVKVEPSKDGSVASTRITAIMAF